MGANRRAAANLGGVRHHGPCHPYSIVRRRYPHHASYRGRCRTGRGRAGRGVRRHRHQPALCLARDVPARHQPGADARARAGRAIGAVLGGDAHRHHQVRHPDHARRQQGRGRRARPGDAGHPWAERREPPDPPGHHAAGRGRAGAVLRRRHHHAGDHGHERRRGPVRRGPGLHALRPAAGARDPGRAVPAAGARHRRCRPTVRAGHAAVVHRAGRAGPLADRQASRRAPRHQPDPRLSPHRRPGARHLLGLRLHRPGGHRRRGALRRHGPFRPQADPHGLAQPRHAGPAAQLLRPGRDDHRRSNDRAAGVLRAGAAGLHHRAGGAVDPGLRHRLAGGHHRRVLAHPPGDPARLPAAHGDQAHLRDRDRPDLHSARSTGS